MRFVVIGCGRWGTGLARTLVERGHEVSIVDIDGRALDRLGPDLPAKRILGSGLDRDMLVRAGVERASGLATVTHADETNIVVARVAREVFHVPKVIARLYDPRRAEIYRKLGIETISTVTWGVQRIADLLAYSRVDVAGSIGHGGVRLIEAEVPTELTGRTVGDLVIAGEAHVVALSRAGRTFLPMPGSVLAPGDRVHLVVMSSAIGRLQRLLGIE